MRPGIELRQDYDAARLRALAKATRNAGQSRRLLALAEIRSGQLTRSPRTRIDPLVSRPRRSSAPKLFPYRWPTPKLREV